MVDGQAGYMRSDFISFDSLDDISGIRAASINSSTDNAAQVWSALKAKGFTDEGAAAVLGNMYAESGVYGGNLENVYEIRYGYSDYSYTVAVDNGSYGDSRFANDWAGYGL